MCTQTALYNAPDLTGSSHNTSALTDSETSQERDNSNRSNVQRRDSSVPTEPRALSITQLMLILGVLGLAAGWQFKATKGPTNYYNVEMFYEDMNKLGENEIITNNDIILKIKSGK